jgi:prevent-host-death family protein
VKILTSVEAQNGFGQLLDAVQREPVSITRHGRTAAFVVSPADMQELLDARRRRSLVVSEFESWSKETQKQNSSDSKARSAELTDEEVVRLVHQAR